MEVQSLRLIRIFQSYPIVEKKEVKFFLVRRKRTQTLVHID